MITCWCLGHIMNDICLELYWRRLIFITRTDLLLLRILKNCCNLSNLMLLWLYLIKNNDFFLQHDFNKLAIFALKIKDFCCDNKKIFISRVILLFIIFNENDSLILHQKSNTHFIYEVLITSWNILVLICSYFNLLFNLWFLVRFTPVEEMYLQIWQRMTLEQESFLNGQEILQSYTIDRTDTCTMLYYRSSSYNRFINKFFW